MATDFNKFHYLKGVPEEACEAAKRAIMLNLAARGLQFAARVLVNSEGKPEGFAMSRAEDINEAVGAVREQLTSSTYTVEQPSPEYLQWLAREQVRSMVIPD